MNKFFKKNNKGFTMIELVLTVGIVALIGSVLVQGIVTAKSSTEVTDVQEFMDDFTTQARESFKAEPSKIVGFINDQVIAPTSLPYPYNEMLSISNGKDEAGRNKPTHFEKYFTADLMDFKLDKNDPNTKYAVEIKLKTDNPTDSNSFSFSSSKWAMNIKVSMKKTGTNDAKFDEMYTKKYEFDNVSLANVITKPSGAEESKVVRFYANGGEIVGVNENGGTINKVENSVEVEISNNNASLSAYVPKVAHKSDKKVPEPIGWSMRPKDSKNLVDLTKVNVNSGATKYYAQYIDANSYQVTLRLENSEQSFNDNLNQLFEKNGYEAPYTQFSNGRVGTSDKHISHFLSVGGSEKLFYENNKEAVIQPNKKFKGWKDKKGNIYDYSTPVGDVGNHHLVLMPYMIKSDDVKPDNVKAMNIDVNLDLSNEETMFGYENVSYKLDYDYDSDSFVITATSTVKDANVLALNPDLKTSVVKTYTPNKSNIYFTTGGSSSDKSKKTLNAAYFKNLDSQYQKVKITGINLNVIYKGMDLGEFKANANSSNYSPIKVSKSNKVLTKDELVKVLDGKPIINYTPENIGNIDKMMKKIEFNTKGFADKVPFNSTNSKVVGINKGNSSPRLESNSSSKYKYDVIINDVPTVAIDVMPVSYHPMNYSYRIIKKADGNLYIRLYMGWENSDDLTDDVPKEVRFTSVIKEREALSCGRPGMSGNCTYYEAKIGEAEIGGIDAYVGSVTINVNGKSYVKETSKIGMLPASIYPDSYVKEYNENLEKFFENKSNQIVNANDNTKDQIASGTKRYSSIPPSWFDSYISPQTGSRVPKTEVNSFYRLIETGNSKYSFTTNGNVSILPTWLKS
ncbi:MAG: type II secretion system protein [Erysipelotrichaceae bacterium]